FYHFYSISLHYALPISTGLIILLFIVGPTVYILNMFTTTIGNYLQNFLHMSMETKPVNDLKREWINNWTIFYWVWWISWSPFVEDRKSTRLNSSHVSIS